MILENTKLKVTFDDHDGSLIGLVNKSLNKDAISSKASAENFRLSISLSPLLVFQYIEQCHNICRRRSPDNSMGGTCDVFSTVFRNLTF